MEVEDPTRATGGGSPGRKAEGERWEGRWCSRWEFGRASGRKRKERRTGVQQRGAGGGWFWLVLLSSSYSSCNGMLWLAFIDRDLNHPHAEDHRTRTFFQVKTVGTQGWDADRMRRRPLYEAFSFFFFFDFF